MSGGPPQIITLTLPEAVLAAAAGASVGAVVGATAAGFAAVAAAAVLRGRRIPVPTRRAALVVLTVATGWVCYLALPYAPAWVRCCSRSRRASWRSRSSTGAARVPRPRAYQLPTLPPPPPPPENPPENPDEPDADGGVLAIVPTVVVVKLPMDCGK